ncbi:MAG TPA: hypothetical protein VF045_06260 [Acidimicrobiales bacterium]
MGFLDRAKKLAEQALEKAEQALDQAKERTSSGGGSDDGGGRGGGGVAADVAAGPRMGTPYVEGMLGRPGWRERGLVDPAAVLPVDQRDQAGVPHSTRSVIVEEPYGMGRRWTSGLRSLGLFYQLYPEHEAWVPPVGVAPLAGVPGAMTGELPDGRTVVLLGAGGKRVVLETSGLDDAWRTSLARTVSENLASA